METKPRVQELFELIETKKTIPTFEIMLELFNRIQFSRSLDGYSLTQFLRWENGWGDTEELEEDYIDCYLDNIERLGTDKSINDSFETVEFFGGEGEGDTWWWVVRHKASNRYAKIEGWYASYHGYDFNDYNFDEVFPKEKVITVYE